MKAAAKIAIAINIAFMASLLGCTRESAHITSLRKAAEKGDIRAKTISDIATDRGEGVKQDYGEAVKWYRKAAEQGDAFSQGVVGFYCYQGKGVPQDFGEAVKWYRKAADQGNAHGQLQLGMCYYRGEGVKKDNHEAAQWLHKAADQGDEWADEMLNTLRDLPQIGIRDFAPVPVPATELSIEDLQRINGQIITPTTDMSATMPSGVSPAK